MNLSVGKKLLRFDNVSDWLLEYSLAGTAVLTLAVIASVCARKERASLRHAVWVASLLVVALSPLLVCVLPGLSLRPNITMQMQDSLIKPTSVVALHSGATRSTPLQTYQQEARETHLFGSVDEPSRHSIERGSETASKTTTEPRLRQSNRNSKASSTNLPRLIVLFWFIGSCACLGRLVASTVWLGRVKSQAKSDADSPIANVKRAFAKRIGLSSRVDVRISSNRQMPMAFGVLRPTVLIPSNLLELSEDERAFVLLHELGHLRRRDPLWQLVVELAGVFFWFHPLFWIAKRHCGLLREQACDDLVLRCSDNRVAYAKCLLSVTSATNRNVISMAPGVAMSTGRMEHRIATILKEAVDRRPLNGVANISILLLVFILVASVLAVRAESQNPPADKEEQTQSEDSKVPKNATTQSPSRNAPSQQPPKSASIAVTDEAQPGSEVQLEESAPPDSKSFVEGRIVDASGMPIEGASIFSFKAAESGELRTEVAARSDTNGQFRIQSPKSARQESDRLTIWAWAEGYQLQGAMLGALQISEDHLDDVELHLPNAEKCEFKVVQPDGTPLKNATLVPGMLKTCQAVRVDGKFALDAGIVLYYPLNADEELGAAIGSITDNEGTANLQSIPRGLYDRVDVISEKYGRQRFFVREAGQTLQLAPVGAIKGRVQIDDPSLIEGTRFSVFASGPGKGGPDKGLADVRLDADGCFQVPAMIANSGTLFVHTHGWNKELDVHPFLDRRKTPRLKEAGQVMNLLIETVPTVLVTGKVELADTHAPVVDANVVLNCLSSPLNGVRTKTDGNGRFSLRIAPGWTLRQVTTMGSDHALYKKYDYPRLEKIEIPQGIDEFKLPTFQLTPKTTVQGQVRGQLRGRSGQPLGGVTIAYHRNDSTLPMAKTVTDSQGKFSVAVRDWIVIQKDPSSSARYGWSILKEENRVVDGYRQPEFIPLIANKRGPNSLELRQE